ncbi:MAG: SLC13 family permease [Myxococcaceae bacterium]
MPEAGSDNVGRLRRGLGITVALAGALALVFVPTGLQHVGEYGARPAYAAAVAWAMGVLWFTEALPIALTASLPLVFFPILGIHGTGLLGDARAALVPFFDAYIFLFLGGMALGAAMEEWSLHRRIALHIMRAVGTEPSRLLMGMLVATAAVSLWISNTATAVMMVPIAIALVKQLERDARRSLGVYGSVLLLAVAYAANVGGIGTKIGTAPNSVFAAFVTAQMGIDMGFFEFSALALPFVLLFLPMVWWVLWRYGRALAPERGSAREVLDAQLAELGPLAGGERRVAYVFVVAAVLWMLGDVIRPLIAPRLPFPILAKHYEAAVGCLAGAVLLGTRLLSLNGLWRLPWSSLVLLGGSLSLAAGMEGSGLAAWLGVRAAALSAFSPTTQLIFAVTATVAFSAIASNVATLNVMVNILPRSLPLLFACTIAASCDFALPAGTPPNAIVFASGRIRLPDMMRIGVVLDVLAIVVLVVYGRLYLWAFL